MCTAAVAISLLTAYVKNEEWAWSLLFLQTCVLLGSLLFGYQCFIINQGHKMNGYDCRYVIKVQQPELYIIPADTLSQDNLKRSCTRKLEPAQDVSLPHGGRWMLLPPLTSCPINLRLDTIFQAGSLAHANKRRGLEHFMSSRRTFFPSSQKG